MSLAAGIEELTRF